MRSKAHLLRRIAATLVLSHMPPALVGCGRDEPTAEDRYVTTGSTDGLAFVARLRAVPTVLDHVALGDVPSRLGVGPLAREGMSKLARDEGFSATAEVDWARTEPDPLDRAKTRLAFRVAEGGRDLEWWGTVSRREGRLVLDVVTSSRHAP